MKKGMYFSVGEDDLYDFQQKYNKHIEIDDITYEDYLTYKKMEEHKKFLAPGHGNGFWYSITSAIWTGCGIISGILISPVLFCYFIYTPLFGGGAIYDYVASAKNKEHMNYHQLYKYFKKNKLWDKLKSYMLVYEHSDKFNTDRTRYESQQADKKLKNYINHASFELEELFDDARGAKQAYEQNLPTQERTPDVKVVIGENKIVVHKDDVSSLPGNISVGKMIRELTRKLADKKVANIEITINKVNPAQPATETTETEQISIDDIKNA